MEEGGQIKRRGKGREENLKESGEYVENFLNKGFNYQC
jgi:hypothetical protein